MDDSTNVLLIALGSCVKEEVSAKPALSEQGFREAIAGSGDVVVLTRQEPRLPYQNTATLRVATATQPWLRPQQLNTSKGTKTESCFVFVEILSTVS